MTRRKKEGERGGEKGEEEEEEEEGKVKKNYFSSFQFQFSLRRKMLTSDFVSIGKIRNDLERLKDKEDLKFEYACISLDLISREFIDNKNPAIRIQTAICICKFISQLDFDSPYTDEGEQEILNFLIDELKSFNKQSEHYSQYCELLKTIQETNIFRLSNQLSNEETREKIHENLFQVIFDLVEKNPEDDLKFLMLAILESIIKQAETLSIVLLHNLLQNIVEPQKSIKKEACELARNLIQNTKHDFQNFFINFVNLVKAEGDEAFQTFELYAVAYELRNIFPKVIYESIICYAKAKIKSPEEESRTSSINFFGKMFSDPESRLAITQPELFSTFLGRIEDINVNIRLMVIKFCKKIILKYPDVRNKTAKQLRFTQVDPDPKVRIEGVTSMSKAIFENIGVLAGNEYLQKFLQGVKHDPEFSVREAELASMSIVFKKYVNNCMDLNPELRKALLSIQTRILYAYSEKKDIKDAILIEKLFREKLVPWDLPVEERMKRLFHLYSTLHSLVLQPFAELQESEYLSRKLLAKWVELIKVSESRNKIWEEFRIMTKFKKGPMASMEFVKGFECFLNKNPRLVAQIEKIVAPHISCEERIVTFNIAQAILSKSNETFYAEFLSVIERGTSFTIDDESVRVLIEYVFEALEGGSIIEELHLNPLNAGDRGLKLLQILVKYFPESFEFEDILERFINFVESEVTVRKSLMISLLTALGKRKPLYQIIKSESTQEMLISSCKNLAIEGTCKESKESIRCLKYATQNFDLAFEEILGTMDSKATLLPDSDYFLQSVVALGHIATERSDGKCEQVESLMSMIFDFSKVRESIIDERTPKIDWCSQNELSKKEIGYEEVIKCLGRWIYSLKIDSENLQAMVKDFFFLVNRYLTEPYSSNDPTKNRLRAKAACTILKICEREELRHSLPPQNFYDLSKLMNDQSSQATKMFIKKLIKGLKNGLPRRFLTNEFLGFFILAGKQNDKEIMNEMNSAFRSIIEQRNFYLDYMMKTAGNNIFEVPVLKERLFEWLPEFSIVWALPILARDPDFKNFEKLNLAELKKMDKYLWNFLEPLVERSNFNCPHIFTKIGEKLQDFGDAHSSDLNEKLWTLNELFLTIVNRRIKKSQSQIFEVEIEIPKSHYIELNIPQTIEYLPSLRENKLGKRRIAMELIMNKRRKRERLSLSEGE